MGTLTATLVASKLEYGNIRYIYDQLIDGGSTDNVVQEITSTWTAQMWALRSSLLANSPYLSVGALMELVKEPDVPLAIKAEVLVANPDATMSPGFLSWAQEQAVPPLPAYIINSVVASWRTSTYRTVLEGQMADKHTTMTQAANGLIHLFHQDTVEPTADTLLWVWRQLPTNAARFAEASLLVAKGDLNSAYTLVQAMSVDDQLPALALAERTNMLTYIGVLRDAENGGRDAYELNSTERSLLSNLVADHYDRPSGWAANLLCAAYGNCRPPNTGGGRTTHAMVPHTLSPTEAAPTPSFTLQPNPASTWCAVSFQGLTDHTVAELLLEDASGRTIQRAMARGAQGQVLFDTRGLAPGVYLMRLSGSAMSPSAQRLVVQP